MARTITVQLHAPTFAKQQAFKELQAAFNATANELATQLVRQSLEAVAMVAPTPALATDAFDALAGMFPSGWDHPVIRMVQGQLRAARARAQRSPLPRFKPYAPVVFGDRDWTLTCVEGRWKLTIPVFGRTIQVPVLVPVGQDDALRRLIAMGIPLEGRLYQRRGRWYFAATYLNEAKVSEGEHQVVGVDLGRRMRAVAFSPAGNRRLFVSGRAHADRARRYEGAIARLESAGAHRPARALRLRAERYAEHADRELANRLVRFAGAGASPLIKFENFSQTAPGTAREAASYRRIQRLVSHKAELLGIPVLAVNGHATSQRCYACGTVQPGNRRGARYRCACGYHAHADLNAARNIAQTAIWSETIQIGPGEYKLAGEAVGTAASHAVDVIKGHTDRVRSALTTLAGGKAHAPLPEPPSLGVASPPLIHMEDIEMASLVKDLTESSTKFVTGSLDNLKTYVDRTADEMGKVDMVGVTRRVLDVAIDNTKKVVKLSSEPSGLDFFGKAKAVADGSLEAAKEVVNTISEESKKADMMGVSTRMAKEGLDILRGQVDLTLETTKEITGRMMPATTKKPVATRAPQVTRVEIEQEKPAATSSKASKAQA